MTLRQLANPALLSLAAKKAFRYLDRHSWFFDRSEAATFCGRLTFNIRRLSIDLLSGNYFLNDKLVFAAPKRIKIKEDGSEKFIVRPICVYSFRDQVVETALVCLFADLFEQQWGNIKSPNFPKVTSFGNRLHCVGEGTARSFSLGSSRLYRDWADDYSAFVQNTERAFNHTLNNLITRQRVVLLCCDIKSFYPNISRKGILNAIKPYCDTALFATTERIFGSYTVGNCAGLSKAEARRLSTQGIPQGAVHSGFWSNVYLHSFDEWVKQKLEPMVKPALPGFRLQFYARYVDDMRFVGSYTAGAGAPHQNPSTHPLHITVEKELGKIGLLLSTKKSHLIQQSVGGTLLTTGQVAERMQTLKKRLYLPLPPEDLEEVAKDLRMLFHANVLIPTNKDLDEPHLDNPGVRTESRHRFAAGRWVRVAREMETLLPGWTNANRNFASELARSWLEHPEQIQLLHHALKIGLNAAEISAVAKRMRNLESDPKGYSFFAYIAAYFLDQSSRRGGNIPLSKKIPLGNWATNVLRGRRYHPIFRNKSRQYLITQTSLTKNDVSFFKGQFDGFCKLLHSARNGLDGVITHPAEIASLLYSHGFIFNRKLSLVSNILRKSTEHNGRIFLRQLLLMHTEPELLRDIIRVAEESGHSIPEFAAFRPVSRNPPKVRPELLYRAILRRTFKAPLTWCEFALQLIKLLKRENAILLGSRGLLHGFAIERSTDGSLTLVKQLSPNLDMAGYALGFGSLVKDENDRAWCLPIGLLLHSAATNDYKSLLGLSSVQRFRTFSALQPLLNHGGQLPEVAGDILMKLFSWPGSRVNPYLDIADFENAILNLYETLKQQSTSAGVTICDVRGPAKNEEKKKFSVVLCQIPSHPQNVSDATVRRALAVARLIGKEREPNGDNPPNLVIFPELSVPLASMSTLQRFVSATGAFVLAGLELRTTQRRKLNELIWIIPTSNEDNRPLVLRQHKIHITADERNLSPPILPANPPVIWRIGRQPERLAAINCYEFTDLALRELLRGRIEALMIAANNKDVPTFDNLVESTHYDLFCHVLLVNAERYGGSAIRAPYREPRHRRIFDIHGGDLFAVNLCVLDIAAFRSALPIEILNTTDEHITAPRPIKTPPANFEIRF